jgi:prepilin peptidase CpaA
MERPAMIAALALAAAAAVRDLQTRRIPNGLVLAGAASGLALGAWSSGGSGLVEAFLGGLAGFLVFLPFFLLRGMGAGDVKLMGALGTCLGPLAILQVALAAAFAGAILALVTAARHGLLLRTFRNTGRLLASWTSRGPRPSEELSLDNPEALKIPYALPIAAGSFFIIIQAAS